MKERIFAVLTRYEGLSRYEMLPYEIVEMTDLLREALEHIKDLEAELDHMQSTSVWGGT